MTETVTMKLPLKSLPTMLKKLVTGAGVRPKFVTVRVMEGVPTVTETWRTNHAVGLGEKKVLPTEHWMGDDGESNSSTDVTFTVAAVSTWTKCGSTSKSGATVVLGYLTPAIKEALESSVGDMALSALMVALDSALEKDGFLKEVTLPVPAPVVEEPYTLVDWLTTCA